MTPSSALLPALSLPPAGIRLRQPASHNPRTRVSPLPFSHCLTTSTRGPSSGLSQIDPCIFSSTRGSCLLTKAVRTLCVPFGSVGELVFSYIFKNNLLLSAFQKIFANLMYAVWDLGLVLIGIPDSPAWLSLVLHVRVVPLFLFCKFPVHILNPFFSLGICARCL